MLVAIDTDLGVLLANRDDVERLVRSRLAGHDLLGELLADRRRDAQADSEETPRASATPLR